ncbi:hypothetical protein Q4S41_18485 [Hymenobacter sp. CA1UV-4]|nr:hypothetical protein [Hymenobacter sp. CA1UV-4]
MLAFLLADLGYSFWQYLQLPLDGDLAVIAWPSEMYTPVLHDPFGLRALLHHEVYAAPNRFFAHFFLYEYLRRVPLWLQAFLTPLDSVYMACALLKLAIHGLLLYVLAVAISNRRNVLSGPFLLAAALVTPLLQTSGFSGQMGVIDWSITYAIFYALPGTLLLLFLLPFVRAALHGQAVRLSGLGYAGLVGLAVWLAFNGPVVAATVLLLLPAALLLSWWRRLVRQPAAPWLRRAARAVAALPTARLLLFGFFSLLCLYSLYIGRFNVENTWSDVPLGQRYALLPMGVFYQLTGKLGLPLLLLALLLNAWLVRRQLPTPGRAAVLSALKWLGVFALVYVLLLPLGGYRAYREDILRRDSILPIILGMIGCFALSSFYLLGQLPGAARRRYAAGIGALLAVFTVADKPRLRDYNACERELFATLAQSPAPVVRLPITCTMMDWQPLTDYRKSELNGQLLAYWGIIPAPKLYYQQ